MNYFLTSVFSYILKDVKNINIDYLKFLLNALYSGSIYYLKRN